MSLLAASACVRLSSTQLTLAFSPAGQIQAIKSPLAFSATQLSQPLAWTFDGVRVVMWSVHVRQAAADLSGPASVQALAFSHRSTRPSCRGRPSCVRHTFVRYHSPSRTRRISQPSWCDHSPPTALRGRPSTVLYMRLKSPISSAWTCHARRVRISRGMDRGRSTRDGIDRGTNAGPPLADDLLVGRSGRRQRPSHLPSASPHRR